MPKIAAEISAPISQTNKITMVAGGDGPIGASRITSEVNIQAQGRNVGEGGGTCPLFLVLNGLTFEGKMRNLSDKFRIKLV